MVEEVELGACTGQVKDHKTVRRSVLDIYVALLRPVLSTVKMIMKMVLVRRNCSVELFKLLPFHSARPEAEVHHRKSRNRRMKMEN